MKKLILVSAMLFAGLVRAQTYNVNIDPSTLRVQSWRCNITTNTSVANQFGVNGTNTWANGEEGIALIPLALTPLLANETALTNVITVSYLPIGVTNYFNIGTITVVAGSEAVTTLTNYPPMRYGDAYRFTQSIANGRITNSIYRVTYARVPSRP
jgi:hypothetical protein